ncbi:hypothetical protein HZB94_00715 [Candidatus Falkowbacteria bacterium]|nr:hypothetical protein [Candidatus Falkowbacteria bacterium]
MNSDIKNFIATSFLNEEDKTYLLDILKTKDDIPKFEKELERLLNNEIEKRKGAHLAICQEFEKQTAIKKAKIKKEQEKLLADVTDALSKISETDIAERRAIWLDYDAKILRMNRALLDELDILFSKLTVQHI